MVLLNKFHKKLIFEFQFVPIIALLVAATNGARIPRDNPAYGAPSSRSASASAPAAEPIAIVRSVYNAPGTLGYETTYNFDFEAENGIKQSAEGELKTIDDAEVMVMKGSYSYMDANGEEVVVTWYADETGYHAESSILPVAPEIPFEEQRVAVEAQIRFAAEERAAAAAKSASTANSRYQAAASAPAQSNYAQPIPAQRASTSYGQPAAAASQQPSYVRYPNAI